MIPIKLIIQWMDISFLIKKQKFMQMQRYYLRQQHGKGTHTFLRKKNQ